MKVKVLQKAGVVDSRGRVLVLLRSDSYLGSRPGKWDLPGGSLDYKDLDGDKPLMAALMRELEEETGLTEEMVKSTRVVFVDSVGNKSDEFYSLVIAIGYEVKLNRSVPDLKLSKEHDLYEWVEISEAIRKDFGDDGGFHKEVLRKL